MKAGEYIYEFSCNWKIKSNTSLKGPMEYAATLVSLFTIFLIFLWFYKKSNTHALPPSPPSLPFLGHLHFLITSKLPHHTFLHLSRQYGDLMHIKLGRINALVVSSSGAAKEVFKAHDLVFASRPSSTFSDCVVYHGQDLAFARYGESWRSLRKLCTVELFTAKQVGIFQPLRKLEMSALFSELRHLSADGRAANLSQEVRNLTFNIVSRMVLNKSFSRAAESQKEKEDALLFKKMVLEDEKYLNQVAVGEMFPFMSWFDSGILKKLQANFKRKDRFLEEVVEEHRRRMESGEVKAEERRNLVYVMLALGESLSRTTIKAIILDAFAAGTDTSATTVEWAMSELIRNPRAMKKVLEELEQVTGRKRDLEEEDVPKLRYLQAIVKETLRLHPPAPLLLPHESTEACEVRGYMIPAKTRLFVNAYAIARDPGTWDDPLTFAPERFLDSSVDVQGQSYEVLPFGTGRRKCPGILLGLTTVNYTLGSLLNSFDWELPSGLQAETLDMSESFGLTMPRASPLKLIPHSLY